MTPTNKLRAATSDLVERSRFASATGLTFAGKRDLNLSLGYLNKLTPRDYLERYERGGIAQTIVEAYPLATWAGGAAIIEDPTIDEETPWETEVRELFERLDIWSRILRADILAGLGRYSAILLGVNAVGELSTELGNLGPKSLIYLKNLGESDCKIKSLDVTSSSERFGLPEIYTVDIGSGLTKDAHWSRIIHIAEGTLKDDIYGKPRLRPVWNYLDDLAKLVGGGAESAWQRMSPGMQLNMDPEATLTPADEAALSDEVDEYLNGMRRVMRTKGIDLNLLSGSVAMFGSNVDCVLKLICSTSRIPSRVFSGSERGELASSQDEDNWFNRISERKRQFAVPLVKQMVDRLIAHGILREPNEPYQVIWPDIDELNEDEKASVSEKLARANKAQVESGDTPILTSDEIRNKVWNLDPLEVEIEDIDEDENETIDDEEIEEESQDSSLATAAESSEWKQVHKAAGAHRDAVTGVFLSTWASAVSNIDVKELKKPLEFNNPTGVERIVFAAIDKANEESLDKVNAVLKGSFDAGANAALRSARGRGSWLRGAASLDTTPLRQAAFTASFDTANPRAVQWALDRSSELITEVGKGTKDAAREFITEGIREGLPPRVLQNKIKQIIGLRSDQIATLNKFIATGASPAQIARKAKKLLKQRALLIARTETLRSANAGQRELWIQARNKGEIPTTVKRVWIVTNDDRLRDSHADMSGQIVGIEESFTPAIEPGSEPNCRCAHGLTG